MVFIVLAGVAVAAAFGLVVVNRDSPEIVKAAAPLAIGAMAGLWLAFAFAFAQQPMLSRVFPVTLFIDRASKLPIAIPDRPFPWITLGRLPEAAYHNPKILANTDGLLYHQFLQYALLDWIAQKHFGTWRMRLEHFQYGSGDQEQWSPAPDATGYKSRVLAAHELTALLEPSPFAHATVGVGRLAVPWNTVVAIIQPNTIHKPARSQCPDLS